MLQYAIAALSRRILAASVMLLASVPLWSNPAGPLEVDFNGWQRTETAHFVFVFEPRDSRAVSQLVSFAEDVYQDVTEFIGARPNRVWVIVAGRVDLANAITYPFPPHITLYLAPPSEPLVGLEASSYLRLLLAHELTHFVNFEYDKGPFAFLSTLFGPAVKEASAAFLPTWFLEGIATHSETLFTDGGRGRNPFFEMEYRAFALSDRFFPLSKAAYSSYFPPADRDWIGGYLFFRYLFDHYGSEIYIRIHDEYVKFPFLGPWKAIERATGKPADLLYSDMVAELKAHYSSQKSAEEGTGVVPNDVADYYLPVITSQGWYLYRSAPDKAPGIVQFDPVSMRERILLSTPLTDSASLTASEDGTRIGFSTYEATLGSSGEIVASDLFEMDRGTGAVRRITAGGHAWQPRLSPDGSRLLAVSAIGPCSRLVEVDQRSGSLRLLFSMKEAIVSTPTISSDGLLVAFAVSLHGAWSIRVLSLSSPEAPITPSDPIADFNVNIARIVVGPTRAGAYYPRFTDSGNIFFSSNMDGSLALYATDTDGSRCTLVCEDPIGAWAGELAENRVLYATYRTDGYTLRIKDMQSEPREPLTAVSEQNANETAAGAFRQAPYVDLPRFLAWAPLPIYYSTIAAGEIVAAPGAAFWGVSNLGTSSYAASISFRTDALQPAVELSLQTTASTVGLGYSLSEGYTNVSPTDHRQELDQQVSSSFPLISSTKLNAATALSLLTSVNDALIAEGPQVFSFMDGLGAGTGARSLSYSHDIDATVGVGYQQSSIDSPMDLFALSQTIASLDVSLYPPVLSATGPGTITTGLLSFSFPSSFAHQALQLGLKTSYVSFNETFYQITNPRGAFDPVIQTMPGRTLLSFDYLIPIALLDAPLAYSLGLVGVGCGLHIEAAADWSTAPVAMVADRDIYTGVELVLDIAIGEQAFPVGLGLSFRFDPHFVTPPDLGTDLRPYIFISNDSFAGTILGARLKRPATAP
jgi:hypothetical protein